MRVKVTKNKNSQSFYVIKDVNVAGKRTTKIVAALGNENQLREKHPDYEPLVWAKKQAKLLTQKEKANQNSLIKSFSAAKLIEKDKQRSFNVGYLFLQDILSQLGLKQACKKIQAQTRIKYDLYNILALLIYARILSPSSKKSSLAYMQEMLGVDLPNLHDIYRALSLLSERKEELVSASYHNSINVKPRDTRILYYDCTNFYFEIEAAEDMKQYGVSKEHRPNPIIQMGLFMDANGLPLSFTLFDGNKNEQPSMKPLEKEIMRDFHLSDFVVCTDAGLSSNQNRKYNSFSNRHFITTQSIKKLKKNLKDWALDPSGWQKPNDKTQYNLNELNLETDDSIYYKIRPINENDLEQNLFVTFSPKYLRYQRQIRQGQIDRAIKQANSKQKNKRNNP
ncbi:transposase, partial [Lactobacillus helveticus]